MRERMDWAHIDFDWNQARAFLAAADLGSYTAAAKALGSAQPTVGWQVAALEEALGVRSPRGDRVSVAARDCAPAHDA